MYYRFENVAKYLRFDGKYKTKKEVIASLEKACAFNSINYIISTDKPNFIVIKRDKRELGGKVFMKQIKIDGITNIIQNNPFRIMLENKSIDKTDRIKFEELIKECSNKNLYLAGTLFNDNELQAFVLSKIQKYSDNISKVKVIPKITKFGTKDKIYKSVMLWINDKKYLDKITDEINNRCCCNVAEVTSRINNVYCIEVKFI